jgi:hypothetical protein
MEMVDEATDDPRARALFSDIKASLGLSSVNSVFRSLALWPDYLAKVWEQLKPGMQSEANIRAADALREQACGLARRLPYTMSFNRSQLKTLGADEDEVMDSVQRFEAVLPHLIVDVSRLTLDAELEA